MVDITSFRRWAGEQPPERTYDYWHTGETPDLDLCAMGQYLQEQFPEGEIRVWPEYGMVDGEQVIAITPDLDRVLRGRALPSTRRGRQSFGALQRRLAKLELA